MEQEWNSTKWQGRSKENVEFSTRVSIISMGGVIILLLISIFSNDILIGTTSSHSNGVWKFESKNEFEFKSMGSCFGFLATFLSNLETAVNELDCED